MSNDFEKDISQRMQDFSITPQPEIWQRVEAALPPEKKRRFALWWLLPLILLIGAGIWLGIGEHSGTTGKPLADVKEIAQPQPTQKNATTSRETTDTNPLFVAPTHSSNNSGSPAVNNTVPNIPNGNQIAPSKPSVTKIEQQSSQRQFSNTTYTPTTSQLHSTNSTSNYTPNRQSPLQQIAQNRQANKTYKMDTTLKAETGGGLLTKTNAQTADSASVNQIVPVSTSSENTTTVDNLKTTVTPKDSSSANTTTSGGAALKSYTPGATKKERKTTWQLEAGIGKSIVDGDNYKYVGSNFQTSNPATGSLYSNSFLLAQSGLSLSIGLSRRQYFARHWNWQLALHYQLLSSTQTTGGSDTALLTREKNITESYFPGLGFNRRSANHQLQVLPHLGYTIQAGRSLSITLSTGLAVGYSFNTNQLLSDYRTNRYIRSGQYTNRWYAAIHGGLELSWRKKISIGFLYQQSVTNIAKPVLGSDFRWQQWQVQVGIPLFNHPSK